MVQHSPGNRPRAAALVTLAWAASLGTHAAIRIERVPGQAEADTVEVHGVAAGPFDVRLWQDEPPRLIPDLRAPLLRPRVAGVFRNIYAPSVVALPDGWRIFYGGWDGVASGNDRIYSVVTRDFLDFGAPHTEIEHGAFTHVCNVSAARDPNGAVRLLCTAYPDAVGTNKPAYFVSPDGVKWNGAPAPYPAARGDLIEMEGYADYAAADINGMNVLLIEDGVCRLYFGDFKALGHVHRASAADGRHFRYDGPCLPCSHMVNDVKKIVAGGQTTYLMAIHGNTERLWYALSADGLKFDRQRELLTSLGESDKFIVAVGWVVRDDRLLGLLYGAGAVPSLDRNRIYARWLQKRLVFTDSAGERHEPVRALGPDRQVLSLKGERPQEGHLQVLAEDGRTSLCEPIPLTLVPGAVYRIDWGQP